MAENFTKVCYTCKQAKDCAEFNRHSQKKDGLSPNCKLCDRAHRFSYIAKLPPGRAQKLIEDKRAYDAAYTQRHIEKIRARASQAYYDNRDARKEYVKAWCAANPDLRRAIAQNYKHRRRAVEREGISGRELAEWRKAQPKKCYWCGSKTAKQYVTDHYHPLAKGGKHEVGNLVLSCRPCNAQKSAQDPFEFALKMGRLL